MARLTEWTGFKYDVYDPISTMWEYSEINLQKLIDRLGYYEDLAEAGRLVELPCKVGDTVWFIRPLASKKEITETTVEKMVVKGKGLFMKLACNAMYETSCNSIGKTVFLTREEAEAALKGGDPNE